MARELRAVIRWPAEAGGGYYERTLETRRSPVDEQRTRTGSARTVRLRPDPVSSGTGDGPYMACLRGKSFPLGATLAPGGANFSVFAKHSTGAQLLLFDDVDAPTPSRVVNLDLGLTEPTIIGTSLCPASPRARSMDTGSPDLSIPREGCVSTPTRYCSTLTGNA
jgi:hypothetical protein